MALPKIDVPIHTVDLPLTKKNVRFRPFLVKEEKLLLMALESMEEKTILDSIKQIVNNCCLDDIDVNALPIADLEFFFLNLRARSVGEVVELQYKCNNKVKDEQGEEKTCNHVVKFDLNILEIKPEIPPNHSNKIELSKDLGIVMKYPSFGSMKNLGDENLTEIDKVLKIVVSCIDYIYDTDSMYYRKDLSDEELSDFVDSMSREQFNKVQAFFESMPKIKKEVDFNCTKCGYKENIVVEGLQNFFV